MKKWFKTLLRGLLKEWNKDVDYHNENVKKLIELKKIKITRK